MDNKKIINLLKRNAITYDYKICVLNPDETVAYEIPPQDIIYDSISGSENLQNGQRRELSFKLFNGTGKYTPTVNSQKGFYSIYYDLDNKRHADFIRNSKYNQQPLWGITKIFFEIGIKVGNDEYEWFPKGVYVITAADATQNMGQKEVSFTLKDKYCLLEGNTGKLFHAIEIPVGSNCVQVIRDLLKEDLGIGYSMDLIEPIFDHSFLDMKTQASIKKEAGSTISSIIEELATQMSAEYYYNERGQLVFVPLNEVLLDEQKQISWIYSDDNGDLFNLSNNYDYDNAVNVISVSGESVENGIYSALVVNSDPRSPICVGNIGKRMGEQITDANVWSKTIAMDTGRYYLRKNSISCLKTDITAKLNPLIELNKLIEVDHEFFDLKHEKYIVSSLSFSSNSLEMNIGTTNIQHLTFLKAGDNGYVY